MNNLKDSTYAYLLGLLVGRGHILASNKRLIVEFAHKNKTVEGITTCEKCGGLVTKSQAQQGKLVCKDCGAVAEKNNAVMYEQVQSTREALDKIIVPFLNTSIPGTYSVLGNNTMTLLTIDVKEEAVFDSIKNDLGEGRNYSEFHLPSSAYGFSKELKVEFVNGLFDTAGFPSTGGWLNRDGTNGHGRMRAYFQFVRNWHIVVEVDNFLRSEFGLPIHTVDWGHPNIRDGSLSDYFETSPTSWSREHQLKFFPEYYQEFRFRLPHKQSLFEEFIRHNARAGFTDKWDWLPPGKVTSGRLKAYHPGEKDPRLPKVVRRHFDAFWQINLALGCKYMLDLVKKAENPECFALTGKDEACNTSSLEMEFDTKRKAKTDAIFSKSGSPNNQSTEPSRVARAELAEIDLYAPLSVWLKEYLLATYDEPTEVLDVSATNLNLMIRQSEESLSAFEFCHNYHISPDVVGFMVKSKSLAFIEAKITALNMANVGQLLGYCMVAQPKEAILVSTLQPAISLIRSIQANPAILDYGVGRIKLATWQNNELEFIEA